MKLEIVRRELEKLYLRSPSLPVVIPSWELERPKPNTWVKLLALPSEYSADEALLLCECGDREWVAWVPEHGEIVLHESEFCWCGGR